MNDHALTCCLVVTMEMVCTLVMPPAVTAVPIVSAAIVRKRPR
jgi:hypothetical protein